ncbi:MAG: hypothetical protein ACLFR7_00075 [Opitutales bacterium]
MILYISAIVLVLFLFAALELTKVSPERPLGRRVTGASRPTVGVTTFETRPLRRAA